LIAKNKDVEIYYEILGTKTPPILMIEGIGYSSWMWFKQKMDLAPKRQMVTFDNRGVGKSSSPAGAYTMKDMAEDMHAVVENAGIEKMYVLGVSMGGMIAQEYYFSHGERVSGLILSNTNYGKGSVLPSQEVLKILSTSSSGQFNYEGLVGRMKPATSKHFSEEKKEEFDELVYARLANGDDARGYMGQLYAVAGFDSHERLAQIQAPTLIITADEDIVVPPENATELHRRIPRSKLLVFKGAGHLLCFERFSDYDRRVLAFVDEIESGTFTRVEDTELV
jgi:pimeloyl-ACP methyl ester carboxylesterase